MKALRGQAWTGSTRCACCWMSLMPAASPLSRASAPSRRPRWRSPSVSWNRDAIERIVDGPPAGSRQSRRGPLARMSDADRTASQSGATTRPAASGPTSGPCGCRCTESSSFASSATLLLLRQLSVFHRTHETATQSGHHGRRLSAFSSAIRVIHRRLLWLGRKRVATPPRGRQLAAAITSTWSPA